MAKNFLERLLGFTDNRTDTHYPTHRTEEAGKSSGLTGVARYLQKQAEQETALTGVEKYLAKQAAKTKTTKAAAPRQTEKMTRVERYLAKQASQPAKKAPPVPKTRVEKYLAKQGSQPAEPVKPEKPAAATTKKAAPAEKPAPKESAKKEAPPAAPAAKEEKPASPEEKPAAAKEIVNLSVNASQCQASTGKGTRCKRSNNLQPLQHTVGTQQYIFAVCSQHHNDAFNPHPSALEEK
ncbi:hypothetical protein [Thiolapillus sp.]|uniref:hypothetical protein n=1 Tax=Thiolapillus sp. TaxID=2017437 RepID=UPI003AF5DC47